MSFAERRRANRAKSRARSGTVDDDGPVLRELSANACFSFPLLVLIIK
jgi:hypothetical protein